MRNVDRAAKFLEQGPMTRFELECRLGTSQQRVSEILRVLGAHVVGHEPPPNKGRPAPLYALDPSAAQPSIGRVSSVWQLGATA